MQSKAHEVQPLPSELHAGQKLVVKIQECLALHFFLVNDYLSEEI